MKINGILDIFYGDGDWSFIFTDTETGTSVCGKHCGGEGNIRAIQLYMNGGIWPNGNQPRFYVTQQDMKTRKYNQLTKDFSYLGSRPEEIAKHIQKVIERAKTGDNIYRPPHLTYKFKYVILKT